MEVALEGNEGVHNSPEVRGGGGDGERVDEGNMVGEENEIAGEISGEVQDRAVESPQMSSEGQSVDGFAETSSKPEQVVAEEPETRPSLDEVWESIKSKDGAQALLEAQEARESQEPHDEGNEKGGLSEAPQTSPELKHVPEIKERARPSSLRTRPSTRAKRNVTFKDDYEKVEEEKVHRPGMRRQPGGRQQKMPPACLGLFLALALASLIVYIASPKIPTKPRMWTSVELEKYNGTDNLPPLLLGILGSVFDVSKGWQHYGPGGSYHHFVGRDASRAFVSGNFSDDGLTDSLEGLTPSQIKAIDDWRLFFLSRYVYLGKLEGTFYNKEGIPTKKLHLAEKEVKKAVKIEKQQKLDEERFPNCNSKWTQDKGGEVWCNDGKFPRIAELVSEGPKRGPPRTRCACLAQEELQLPGLKGYDGCDALSSRCKT
ncbi:hypothetical protein KC19_8G179100 [Ceratodon purpureus]|uniref:Cytochrome b5 heme-binding domain-containing protein n=1 Tax=Ceratodon purpureus TaxID=3225 RepID=A0A8T0H055_CERPU|nr:hypothetical protein KC19_8G179100 [Ceratodon purpureus]